jgi:NADPH oxidase
MSLIVFTPVFPDVMEVQFRKPSMSYKPGQWLFLNCPAVSRHQWHPFTITSCPFDPYISIHVRQIGDFTRSLGDAVGAGPHQAKLYDKLDPNAVFEVALQQGQKMPQLRIDGPYGAPADDILEHEVSVIIGAGIGVTPWAANLKNIWNLRESKKSCRLRRLEFVWICRDTSSFEWFQQLLTLLEDQDKDSSFLRIHVYLTQRMDVDAAANIMLNSAGTDQDAVTRLRTGTNFGRPDFKRMLGAISNEIMDGSYFVGLEASMRTQVGVYFCGPSILARDIRTACKAASSQMVDFKFWKEHF